MAGVSTEESGAGRSSEGSSGGQQRYHTSEALVEWRSSEQVENGTPSTSPPYWDSDDDDDMGPKPAELYGKYTWKIDKFSQINKRELRSNAFEVGGYKWYILIYPQGCDVCNHLSLFLCVANHDKLLPGWSHFAQFTIAVVNKDPKKSKYSDTLHRFWKKEHDWGWKKFMELSKVLDGFIDGENDTLIIKAQVQVIRERADRPFRCLDCQYRRELVRVYLTNVEQICRRFVEERRGKLTKLIEDKARWSSFRSFWLGMEKSARRRMSSEKTDSILKIVVKHFFIEKEVTSTLVMDSLYSGLKALEGQTKEKKGKEKYLEAEELPVPIVSIEKDAFVLVDDVLLLLERAAVEPLPPKDEKGPQSQNRTKDGSSEDFNKDSVERDERRLTELGRRTIEIFVLAHIFSKIEVAYQEAVALKRQEELIREEEAAWLAESEQKAKRAAADREKKSKKKQAKQKKSNRKAKDKVRDEKSSGILLDKIGQEISSYEGKEYSTEEPEVVLEKNEALEEVSDVSDSVECVPDVLQVDPEDRDSSTVNWDTDTSDINPAAEASSSGISGVSAVSNTAGGRISTSVMDDSSSTCSTELVPSAIVNGLYKGNSTNPKSQKSPSRGRFKHKTDAAADEAIERHSQHFDSESDTGNSASGISCKSAESESQAAVYSLQDRIKWLEQHVVKKEEEVVSLQKKLISKDEDNAESPGTEKTEMVSPPQSPGNMPPTFQLRPDSKSNDVPCDPVPSKRTSQDSPGQTDKPARMMNSTEISVSLKSDAHKAAIPKPNDRSPIQPTPVTTEKPSMQRGPVPAEKSSTHQAAVTTEKPSMPSTQYMPVMSRPLSAPVIPGPRPSTPVVTMVQSTPLLARSVSAAGRLGPDPSPATHSYVPQSYRNAMMGNHVTGGSSGFSQQHSPSSIVNSSHGYSQPPGLMPAPLFLPQHAERMEQNAMKPNFAYTMVNHDILQNGPQWMDGPQSSNIRNIPADHSAQLLDETRNIDFYKHVHSRTQDHLPSEFSVGTSGRQTHSVLADEFPHLDIINDLLDDEQGTVKTARGNSSFHSFSNGPQHLNRQSTFPGDIGISADLSPSTSSCRFERTQSYHDDRFHHNFGSHVGGPFDMLGEMIPQANSRPYANGHMDGAISSQWQISNSDMSFLGLRSQEGDSYPYRPPEYSNLAVGANGYTIFRPSSGL